MEYRCTPAILFELNIHGLFLLAKEKTQYMSLSGAKKCNLSV